MFRESQAPRCGTLRRLPIPVMSAASVRQSENGKLVSALMSVYALLNGHLTYLGTIVQMAERQQSNFSVRLPIEVRRPRYDMQELGNNAAEGLR